MNMRETPTTQESAQHTDADIHALYRDNTEEVDVQRFTAGLGARLASTKTRARRRPVVCRVAVAAIALVLMAGVGVGAWQAWQHLGRDRQDFLVIGDPIEPTTGPEQVTPPFTYEGSRSISELKLSEIWAQAAATFNIDPSQARLQTLYLCWDRDGLLSQFMLDVITPDGTMVMLTAGGLLWEGHGFSIEGWTQHEFNTFRISPFEQTLPALPADQVLASIDSVGLAAIAGQTGVNLEVTAEREDAFDPGMRGVEIAEKRLVWSFTAGIAQDPLALAAGGSDIVGVSGGNMAALEGNDLTSALERASQWCTLQLAWAWKAAYAPEPEGPHETTTGGVNEFGTPAAYVAVGPLSTGQAGEGEIVEAEPIDARLDGLAFVNADGRIARITGGSVDEIEGTTSCGTGVSYSLGHDWLVYSPVEPYGPVGIDAVPAGDSGETRRLLTHESSNTVVNVRYDERVSRVWFALYEDGDTYSLWTTKPQTSDPVDNLLMQGATTDDPEMAPVSVPLNHDCRGDFAVAPDGSTVVYLGLWESPVKAFLRTQEGETQLPLGLATAYSPVFSPDGSKICFVGSKEAAGETSLWIYDLQTDECTKLEATEGLAPTYPVFSPDGQQIAFRNWELRDLWTVDVDSESLTRYALQVGQTPIAW